MIPFTRRELTNAWRNAQAASKVEKRTNPHRLLLFYAAECGLKAVYLKQQNCEILDDLVGKQVQHDLNRVLTILRVGAEYFLPTQMSLSQIAVKGGQQQRPCQAGTLNQVWRYGGVLIGVTDTQVEKQLEKINEWIGKEI